MLSIYSVPGTVHDAKGATVNLEAWALASWGLDSSKE